MLGYKKIINQGLFLFCYYLEWRQAFSAKSLCGATLLSLRRPQERNSRLRTNSRRNVFSYAPSDVEGWLIMSVFCDWILSFLARWKARLGLSGSPVETNKDTSPLPSNKEDAAPFRVFTGVAAAEDASMEAGDSGAAADIPPENQEKTKKRKSSFFASLREKILYDDLSEDDAILEPPPPRSKAAKSEAAEPATDSSAGIKPRAKPAAAVEKPETNKENAKKMKKKAPRARASHSPAFDKEPMIPDVLLRSVPPESPSPSNESTNVSGETPLPRTVSESAHQAEEVPHMPSAFVPVREPESPHADSPAVEPAGPADTASAPAAISGAPAAPQIVPVRAKSAAGDMPASGAPLQSAPNDQPFDAIAEKEEALPAQAQAPAPETRPCRSEQERGDRTTTDMDAANDASEDKESAQTAPPPAGAATPGAETAAPVQNSGPVIFLPPAEHPRIPKETALLLPETESSIWNQLCRAEVPAAVCTPETPPPLPVQPDSVAPAPPTPAASSAQPAAAAPRRAAGKPSRLPRRQRTACVVRYVLLPQVEPFFAEARPRQVAAASKKIACHKKIARRRKNTAALTKKKRPAKRW